ncbi:TRANSMEMBRANE PROTEIN [Salix purpurea]|uniref:TRANSMEMBRANE PROTEIN n=1 Tax=Salix purpurea TaxID=77065 RepID=A0A9Q1AGD3_SALPP|nr:TRANSMEMBRANE PROTEIN [Salix purpurea]
MFFFKGSLKRNIDVSLENFLNNFTVKNKYGEMAATITVIFASVYIGWAYAKRGCVRKKKARAVFTRSMSLGALHGGKLALERMVDYHRAREDEASLEAAEIQLRDLLAEEHPDFKNLQSVVAKLEMSGKDEAAVRILETELKRARKEGKSHEGYEIEMFLVEMHIYKGDFGKALACECLRHEEISDARRPLYKVRTCSYTNP